jgi:hypothetical protein
MLLPNFNKLTLFFLASARGLPGAVWVSYLIGTAVVRIQLGHGSYYGSENTIVNFCPPGPL